MNGIEESKILVAIAKLETNYKNLEEDMKNVIIKIEECMTKSDVCAQKNFKYMVTTLLASITAVFGWSLYFKGVI